MMLPHNVVFATLDAEQPWSMDTYLAIDGYKAWKKILAEKTDPAEIIEKLLEYSSEKNDLVFDPFIGSGQVAVVSKPLKRKFLGFEIVQAYYKFAKKRLDTDT